MTPGNVAELIWPRIDTLWDRTSGLTMETLKGLAKALADRAPDP